MTVSERARPREGPTARIGSAILITHEDSPARQNIMFCAIATDRQWTVEAAPNGGTVRGRAKAQIALRDRLPRQPASPAGGVHGSPLTARRGQSPHRARS